MPAEMQLLQPLSGYCSSPVITASFVRFDYLAPQVRQEGFVRRMNLPAPVKPAQRAQVIPLHPAATNKRRKRI